MGRRRPRLVVALAAAALAAACREPPPPAAPAPPPAGAPRLLVVVVVDQLRADQLERVRPLLRGGLARLLAEGVVFAEARHGHAITYTAPGHASLVTGLHPARSGIVGNEWFDREDRRWVESVEGIGDGGPAGGEHGDGGPGGGGHGDDRHRDDGGTGPHRLLADGLADWLRGRYPAARVVAAGGKDRGAVPLAGRDGTALWYDDESGGFELRAPGRDEPAWAAAFDRRGLPPELFTDATWRPLPVAPDAARAAGFAPFDRGPFDHGLPRPLGGATWVPTEGYWAAVYRSPFLDEHLVRLAAAAVAGEGLGADPWPDLLGLSFSSLDAVGHQYGPWSLEALDVLLRLDRALGRLFTVLDRRVGAGRWLVALSSDHGVADLPEVAGGHRWGTAEIACLRRAAAAVDARHGGGVWLAEGYLDRELLARRGLAREAVEEAAARQLGRCPGVARVWTAGELAGRADPRAETDAALYRHAHHPERSPDVLVQVAPGELDLVGQATTHGTPYDYDRHVPLVLAGAGLTPGRVSARTLTVDLAPTLAELAGVPVPPGLDGVSLRPLMGERRPEAP